jgi:hypothetical protein
VPGLDEAILASDYALLEKLDENEVLASIRVRRILGTLFRDEWYVEAPAFCEERLEKLRRQQRRSDTYQQRPRQEPPPRRSSSAYSEEEIAHARILGLRGKITFDDIKKCYRERMHEYHPDKVRSLGPKLREVAESEAKKINAAYEFFTRKYRRNA